MNFTVLTFSLPSLRLCVQNALNIIPLNTALITLGTIGRTTFTITLTNKSKVFRLVGQPWEGRTLRYTLGLFYSSTGVVVDKCPCC